MFYFTKQFWRWIFHLEPDYGNNRPLAQALLLLQILFMAGLVGFFFFG